MTKMIYGHMPPFMTSPEFDVDVAGVWEPSDEELSKIQKAKEEYRETCRAIHDYLNGKELPTAPQPDMVNNPGHYTFGNIECIDYIKDVLTKEEFIGYLRGCMIKYQHRLHNKGNSAENAAKMKWYNDRLIKELSE